MDLQAPGPIYPIGGYLQNFKLSAIPESVHPHLKNASHKSNKTRG